MTMSANRTVLGLAAAALLSACGGSAQPAASPSAAAPASANASSSTAKPAAPSASAAPAAAAKPATSAAQRTLSIAYPSLTGASTPLWIADTQGFFAARGLKADVK